jgi:hypothetical protein
VQHIDVIKHSLNGRRSLEMWRMQWNLIKLYSWMDSINVHFPLAFSLLTHSTHMTKF